MNRSDIRNIIISRDKKCQHCGITVRDTNDWNIDHIIPRSVTAVSHLYNLQLLCPDCNENKHDDPYQWNRNLFQIIRFKSDLIFDKLSNWPIFLEKKLQKMYNDKKINKEIWPHMYNNDDIDFVNPSYHSYNESSDPKIWSFSLPYYKNDQPHVKLFKIIKMIGEKSMFDLKSKHGEKHLKIFIDHSKWYRESKHKIKFV